MGGESGNQTYIGIFFLVFSIVSTNFYLDRERRYLQEFGVDKLVLLSFGGYRGEIESQKKELRIVRILLLGEWAMLCQGQRFNFSSPNS